LVFSSLVFLYLFLPLNLILYFVCRRTAARNVVLLLFSLLFYAWGEPLYVFLLLFSASSDYLHGRLIERGRGTWKARAALISSLVINLGLLGFFKYAGFLVESVNALLPVALPIPSVRLPLGISFYTFQTLSYIVDVYRGRVRAQRSYREYLLYLSLYPQLVAGPIVRYADVETELRERPSNAEEIAYGALRFCTGLGKKVILANTAGALCTPILDGNLAALSAAEAWYGVVLFALQIYFDFSGYSDMAIGLGRIFGFHYYENFHYPYLSRSVSEFWRRWHISLGSFFREYVYIPLGGNRHHLWRNLAVTWLLTGLWHGASWNFVLWGALFGILIILERLGLGKVLTRIPRIFSHLYLLLAVLAGWVLFYYTDLGRAGQMFSVLAGRGAASLSDALFTARFMNNIFFFAAALIACLPLAPKLRDALITKGRFYNPALLAIVQLLTCVLLLVVCTAMLVGESYNPFLYFRF